MRDREIECVLNERDIPTAKHWLNKRSHQLTEEQACDLCFMVHWKGERINER